MKSLSEMPLLLIRSWVILIVINFSFLSNGIVAAPIPEQKHETSPMKELQIFTKEEIKVIDWNSYSISEMKSEITDLKFNFISIHRISTHSTLCDLEHYRVTESIVAELKNQAGVRYPKEIEGIAQVQKLTKFIHKNLRFASLRGHIIKEAKLSDEIAVE